MEENTWINCVYTTHDHNTWIISLRRVLCKSGVILTLLILSLYERDQRLGSNVVASCWLPGYKLIYSALHESTTRQDPEIINKMSTLKELCQGLPTDPLPDAKSRDPSIPHAPALTPNLNLSEQRLALENALRYFPPETHVILAPEFAEELRSYGHIYMYRFMPDIDMRAYPIDDYPTNSRQAAAIIHMIMNNLDRRVAQFPQELVTYGGNGQVFSNWAQMVPNYSSRDSYDRYFALGVTMYGQMTAGSYSYIGPQGIVHGTTVFVTSGLGGMSGAQAKAAVVCGCIGVIAEGWLMEMTSDLDDLIVQIRKARGEKRAISIGYHGNVVDVWERLVEEYDKTGDLLCELGSDQTSCHNPFLGGYYPVQLTYEEGRNMMHDDPVKFKNLVQESLRRQIAAINKLSDHGLFFWDYGNGFLLEASRAGADVKKEGDTTGTRFKYPSYVQDIMGDIFSLGFGPFRWVCTSANPDDLQITDQLATSVLEEAISTGVPESVRHQYNDNILWIKEAGRHQMVVGSQARILYSDQNGRISIALAFNNAVADGRLKGPVVLSRDHHDVSGTDSPFRETSNIYDGSAFCADMAVQNVIGDSFRGATWVSLHNGGGVGWGEVINGGFGLVLDGSEEAATRARSMLSWDVTNGVARRCWSGNRYAEETIDRAMKNNNKLKVTIPYHVTDDELISRALQEA
ncbi:hypothetical protein LSH36_994g01034 [Paralvinella palmiformis]|uniref:Urocanate hydratase n=1 Tax=Paralvinella palmiformis TaxID=53620 RepID=A0AAD9IWU3_9ANNE|nr:hypothetical protein LSH36_994g01034 [Paralvinella palmiformis]